jgi:DNA-binding beta-propeller fold protein YncE
MPSVAKSAVRRLVGGGLVATTLLAGCASRHADTGPAPIGPATAAAAPVPSATPTGEIRKLAGHCVAAIVDQATRTLVVLGGADAGAPDTLTVLGGDGVAPRAISLGTPGTALSTGGAGRVLVSTRGGYVSVDLAAGTPVRTGITGEQDTDFTAIARRSDGKLVLGSADGSVFVLSSATGVAHRDKLSSRVDSIVTQGNTAVALERGQTSVIAVDPDGSAQEALRAGDGATTMAADPAGRVLVADTRGGELLVFSAEPLIMRQRYPVGGAPYGIAGSQRLAWVSQTATNTVIGYDLATGIPVEKVRYPTVQQPNILAFDDASGTLYVVSGSGAGVQVIEHAGQPR